MSIGAVITGRLIRSASLLAGSCCLMYSMYRYGWRWLWLQRCLPLISGEHKLRQTIGSQQPSSTTLHRRTPGGIAAVFGVRCQQQLQPFRSSLDGTACVFIRTNSSVGGDTPSQPPLHNVASTAGSMDSGKHQTAPPPPSPLATSSWFEQNISSSSSAAMQRSVFSMDWLLELPEDGYLLPVVQQETAEMHLHSTTIKCVMNSSISSSSSGKVGSGEFGRIIEERIPVGEEVFLMGYVKQLVQWDNTHVGGGGANRHRRMIFGNSADPATATAASYRVQKPLIQLYLISTMSERDLSRWLGRRWLAGSAIGLLFYLWAAIVQIKLQNIR